MSDHDPVLSAAAGSSSGTGDRLYWRSLEQLSGSEEYQRWVRQEFADGADLPPDPVSRRGFLGVIAASVGLAGLTSCRKPYRKILPFAKRPEGYVPGAATYYATAFMTGGYAVGTVVRSHDGRPTKVDGNPDHPASLGGSDAQMQGDLLELYDPARSQKVQRLADGHHHDATLTEFVQAWQPQLAKVARARGEGLALLAAPSSSPALHALLAKVKDLLPQARLFTYAPVNRDAELAGSRLAFGTALDRRVDLNRADVVACFDDDLLGSGPAALAAARAWGRRRQVVDVGAELPRLWVAEPCFTPTGSAADHRLRLRGQEIAAAVFALAAELLAMGAAGNGVNDELKQAFNGWREHGFRHRGKDWIKILAADLLGRRGRAVVTAGPRQPAAVHAAVHVVNQLIGAVGSTVHYTETPAEMAMDQLASLRELASAIDQGQVQTLVCLGSNPVYTAPADLEFGAKLAKVPFSVHLGLHVDETAQRCHWHVPQAHDLETWGDARASDGTVGIVQPLIAPLYGGLSPLELIARLMEHPRLDGHDIVREHWQQQGVGADDFDSWWQRALHDGLVRGTAASPVAPPPLRASDVARAVAAWSKPAAGSAQNLEVLFQAHPAIGDGRYSNNAWLQELPHPVTKLTWDNPALISLATAQALGVGNGDVVALQVGGRSLELPVWITPGHADFAVTLELGYGRAMTARHRVASGAGFDTYRLRSSTAMSIAGGATLRATGGKYQLACTQDHGTLEGRELYRENSLTGYRQNPTFAPDASPLAKAAKLQNKTEKDLAKSLWTERDYGGPYQWGMAIDLSVCTGCSACVVACQAENNIPVVGKQQVIKGREMHWLRIDRYFTVESGQEDPGSGKGNQAPALAPDPQMVAQPVPCMQCENAPCESVCPVAATTHSPEGLNDMVYNRCIGTRYCSNNCPYKVRRFNFFDFTSRKTEVEKMAMNPDVTVRSRGVMEKCTYCVQRIEAARSTAKSENRGIRDGDVVPACAQSCPTEAITFGNIADSSSQVAQRKRRQTNYAMLSELNVKPRTSFLARIRNPHPELV